MPLTNPLAWHNRLDSILDGVCECLEENTALGAPRNADGSFNCYRIHSDEWPGDCCDSLILKVVNVQPIDPTSGFPAAAAAVARNARGCATSFKIDFQLRLFRPCGVMAGGNNLRPILPTGVELETEADEALLDVNAMLCCLTCEPFGDPSAPNYDRTAQFYLGSTTPFKSGDCFGWQINGSVTLPNCSFV